MKSINLQLKSPEKSNLISINIMNTYLEGQKLPYIHGFLLLFLLNSKIKYHQPVTFTAIKSLLNLKKIGKDTEMQLFQPVLSNRRGSWLSSSSCDRGNNHNKFLFTTNLK